MEAGQVNRYVQAAISFAHEAIANEHKQHGQRIIKAARRFLRDLERTDCGFTFEPAYAAHACAWIEQLPHVEGRWATPVIRLEPFQCFAIVQLFGFRRIDPTPGATMLLEGVSVPFRPRRFTSMLYATARKNAKSTIAAGIGLYIQSCEPEDGQQLYSAATTYKQAMPIFATAKRMVEKCSAARRRHGITVWSKKISTPESGGEFQPLHAKASTQDGLNPSCTLIDEVHAHKTGDLINVLTSAAGARSAPFFGYFTTEGYISKGPWSEIRDFCDKLLDEIFEADHYLVIFFSIDKDDEEFDETAWVKANPLMLTNKHLLKAIRDEAAEAKGMPSKLAEFKIKRLNRESNHADSWVDVQKWRACDGAPVTLDDFAGLRTYGGLDLSSTTDIASFRIAAMHPARGLITWARRWVTSKSRTQRSERGFSLYAGWVESGLVEECEGEVIDQRLIKQAVLDIRNTINLIKVATDPWNAAQLSGELIEEGIDVENFIQGTKSYHPVMKAFEALYLTGGFAHGSDPVLLWCASNLIARRDVNLNMAPDKRAAPDKIDDFVALLMAYGALLSDDSEGLADVFSNPLN